MEGRRMGKGKLFVVRIGKFFSNQRASSSFLMARKASRERMGVFFHVPLARGLSRYSPNRELVSRRLGFPRKYSQLLSLTPPSSSEASLCRRETGERKESARGTMGRGKREKRPFPLLIIPLALSIFRLQYCYFYWDTQREHLRRREL